MGVAPGNKRLVKLVISRPADVAGTHGMQGYPDAEEVAGRSAFLPARVGLDGFDLFAHTRTI